MRYAIFSDVHANRQAWEAVRDDALRQGADTLICLGDVVGYGPKPLEVLTSIRGATPNFVLGNHDAAACGRLDASIFNDQARAVIEWTSGQLDDDALAFLNQVPLQMDGPDMLLVHAEVATPGEFGYINGPEPAATNLAALRQPLAFIGHTHLPLAYTMPANGGPAKQLAPVDFKVARGNRTIVNVGSVGEPRTTDVRASYVIYDDQSQMVCFRKVAFDVDAYRRDLEEVGLDIRPYFLQVVESGLAADAPSPVAGPQLAMADLPKVAEGVSGTEGHLVLGRTGKPIAPVQQPRILSGGVIASFIVLIVVIIGGLVGISLRDDDAQAPAIAKRTNTGPENTAEASPKPAPDPTPPKSVTKPKPKPKPRTKPKAKPNPKAKAKPKPAPGPPPPTTPAAKLSEALLSYWSFDRLEAAPADRIEKHDNESVRETLVSPRQRIKMLVPKTNIGTAWRQPDFDATDWMRGLNGVGYEEEPAHYQHLIKTVTGGSLKKRPHSVYVRIPFKVDDPAAYRGLALTMRYDDGFAAFLNGEPMASKNAPEPLAWNSASTTNQDDEEAVKPELFKVSANLVDLEEGWNVLAIHGLNGGGKPNATNNACGSSDFLILPTLVALRRGTEVPEPSTPPARNPHDAAVTDDQITGKFGVVDGRFGDAGAFRNGTVTPGTPGEHAIGRQSFSVGLWFSRNPRTVDKPVRHLISSGTSDSNPAGWALSLGPSAGSLVFDLSNGRHHATVSVKAKHLANGQWHHAMATVDRPSGMVQLYLDGKRVAGQRVAFVNTGTIPSKTSLVIGGNAEGKQPHRGRIDEVALWHRTLVPEEITRIVTSKQSLGAILDAEGN